MEFMQSQSDKSFDLAILTRHTELITLQNLQGQSVKKIIGIMIYQMIFILTNFSEFLINV